MSNYRRLISYIYAYEGGIKGKNVGFAKLEVRNGQCKIQVNVRNVYIGSQDTGVYLLSGSEEILIGRIFIRNGAGEFRAVVAVGNVAGSGHTIDQCYGLTVHNLSDSWQCYTTIWEDAVAHAAEVALEGATSEQVKKEEPVEGAIAKAVEEEIEAQSRQEEEQKLQKGDEPPLPSSLIPPEQQPDREILRPADIGVMEIRPMEVLPIGKEQTAADLNREEREEKTKSLEESQGNSETVLESPSPAGEPPKQHPESEKIAREPEQDGDSDHIFIEAEKPVRPESNRQIRMQSMPQPGMLFPPSWFPRPNRQSRPVQPQPVPYATGRMVETDGQDLGLNRSMQSDKQASDGQNQPMPGSQDQPVSAGPNQSLSMNQEQPVSAGQSQPMPAGQDQPMPAGQDQPMSANQNRPMPAGQSQPVPSDQNQAMPAGQSQPVPSDQNQAMPAGQNQPLPAGQNQPSPAGQNGRQQQGEPGRTVMPESSIPEDEPKIDSVWQRFYKTYPKIQAFDYNGGCEILTIKPQDIGLLPRETWGYGNNSFLLHGYYNHRYLIFARLNNPKGRPRFLLGVPGHYYSNEKYMAAMFGFPNFVLSKVQPTGEDRFGYWYTDIRL